MTGATGGVGLAAVDLAKALGCRVIATSRSMEKLAVVMDHYAPDAVVTRSEDGVSTATFAMGSRSSASRRSTFSGLGRANSRFR